MQAPVENIGNNPFQPAGDRFTILRAERERLRRYSRLSPVSKLGYGYDWDMWVRWCGEAGCAAFPADADLVSLYLTDLLNQGKKVTTVSRRAYAIRHVNLAAGAASPLDAACKEVLSGARRQRGEQPRQMNALSLVDLKVIAKVLTDNPTPLAVRNRAILVVGFFSALRRSNLTELQFSDVEFDGHGIILGIRREKQDRRGEGRLIGLPSLQHPEICPVRCLAEWIAIRGTRPGALFTHVARGGGHKGLASPTTVERLVKVCRQLAGLTPEGYGAHSLRAGFVTEAGEAGVSDLMIASQTGHRSLRMVRTYFRRRDLFKNNPCTSLDK